jgi:H+/Cl- antiporter ClcA
MSLAVYVFIGLVFGLIAAAMAFLIVFDEYRKHRFRGWRLWKEGLLAAALALVVFVLLSIAAGAWLKG